MKWYVLTLFLVMGLVGSVSAQQIDSKLVGVWETHDGPCSPCVLTIQEGGGLALPRQEMRFKLFFHGEHQTMA